MATHTHSGNGFSGRRFSISREGGQTNKEGRPFFFERIEQLPPEDQRRGRKFETRTSPEGVVRYYELFGALDGYLTDITKVSKTFNGTKQVECWLALELVDTEETYRIEVGQLDGRYSLDVMKRLLDPAFDPRQKLRLAPFSMKDDKTGKSNIGISTISGTDSRLLATKESAHLNGLPQATTSRFKSDIMWDFGPPADWLYEQLHAMVVPSLKSGVPPVAVVRTPLPAPGEATARQEPFPERELVTDDLPF